jgi:hypothetical protein
VLLEGICSLSNILELYVLNRDPGEIWKETGELLHIYELSAWCGNWPTAAVNVKYALVQEMQSEICM